MNISHDVFLPTLLYSYIRPANKVKLNSVMIFWIDLILFSHFYYHSFVS